MDDVRYTKSGRATRATCEFIPRDPMTQLKKWSKGLKTTMVNSKMILRRIMAVEMTDGAFEGMTGGAIFGSPVDVRAFGQSQDEYLRLIGGEACDLGTIIHRIEEVQYDSLEGVDADVQLTFDNAVKYNGKGHAVAEFAEKLRRCWNSGMRLIGTVKLSVEDARRVIEGKEPLHIERMRAKEIERKQKAALLEQQRREKAELVEQKKQERLDQRRDKRRQEAAAKKASAPQVVKVVSPEAERKASHSVELKGKELEEELSKAGRLIREVRKAPDGTPLRLVPFAVEEADPAPESGWPVLATADKQRFQDIVLGELNESGIGSIIDAIYAKVGWKDDSVIRKRSSSEMDGSDSAAGRAQVADGLIYDRVLPVNLDELKHETLCHLDAYAKQLADDTSERSGVYKVRALEDYHALLRECIGRVNALAESDAELADVGAHVSLLDKGAGSIVQDTLETFLDNTAAYVPMSSNNGASQRKSMRLSKSTVLSADGDPLIAAMERGIDGDDSDGEYRTSLETESESELKAEAEQAKRMFQNVRRRLRKVALAERYVACLHMYTLRAREIATVFGEGA